MLLECTKRFISSNIGTSVHHTFFVIFDFCLSYYYVVVKKDGRREAGREKERLGLTMDFKTSKRTPSDVPLATRPQCLFFPE